MFQASQQNFSPNTYNLGPFFDKNKKFRNIRNIIDKG